MKDKTAFHRTIQANIRNGKYNNENLNFWKKIFRISYVENALGIYKEIYLFNRQIYCNLLCRYVYE